MFGKHFFLIFFGDNFHHFFQFSGVIDGVDFISVIKIYVLKIKIRKLKKIECFVQNRHFWSENDFFGQNRNFGQKSKLWKTFEISVRKKNFGEQKIFWAKISEICAGKVDRNSSW